MFSLRVKFNALTDLTAAAYDSLKIRTLIIGTCLISLGIFRVHYATLEWNSYYSGTLSTEHLQGNGTVNIKPLDVAVETMKIDMNLNFIEEAIGFV